VTSAGNAQEREPQPLHTQLSSLGTHPNMGNKLLVERQGTIL
jgi:hypothetical protein